MTLEEIFGEVETILNEHQEKREAIREAAKDLECSIIKSVQIIRRIHQGTDITEEAKQSLADLPEKYKKIEALIPEGAYFKFHDIWRITTTKCCFVLAFIGFLEKGALVPRGECAAALGLSTEQGPGLFHLELEDYLIGVLDTCSELARLAPNSVVNGLMERPGQIHKFLCDIAEGYAQLNLKNDRLRKRFDALKYDVQKVENVIYDLQVRGVATKKE